MDKTGPPVYHPVRLDRDYLTGKALEQFGRKHPGPWRSSSAWQKMRIREEFRDFIISLEESLATDDPAFLIDQARWSMVHLTSLHFPKDHVSGVLVALEEVLKKELPGDFRDRAGAFISESLIALRSTSPDTPSFISADNPLADTARAFLDAVISADRKEADRVLSGAVSSGIPVKEIYLHIFQPVLQETGRLWQVQQISIAQEHFATAFIETLMARIHDRALFSGGGEREGRGTTVIAAGAGGELHDVGIRMVADLFEMDGWITYYTGSNTPPRSILAAAGDRKPDMIALSITMPANLPDLQYLIRSLRADPGTAGIPIIVGGYPFRIVPGLWKQIGADAFAGTADETVAIADRLVPVRRRIA
jgi:MerR family transcriptional regulator, light-induced transcriptional regulator